MNRDRIAVVAEAVRSAGCPDFLNRWLGMTPERLEAAMAKIGPREQKLRDQRVEHVAAARDREFNPHAGAQRAAKLEKARVRIERLKARQSGKTSEMPLSGKDALAAVTAPAAAASAKPEAALPPKHEEPVMNPATLASESAKKPNRKERRAATSTKKKAAKPAAKRSAKPAAKKPAAKAAPKKAPKPKTAKPAAPAPEVREGTKTALIRDLLLRREGCTTEDVLKATGWPSVSMPQQAKAVGLELSKTKEGKVTRYRGVIDGGAGKAVAPASVDPMVSSEPPAEPASAE